MEGLPTPVPLPWKMINFSPIIFCTTLPRLLNGPNFPNMRMLTYECPRKRTVSGRIQKDNYIHGIFRGGLPTPCTPSVEKKITIIFPNKLCLIRDNLKVKIDLVCLGWGGGDVIIGGEIYLSTNGR